MKKSMRKCPVCDNLYTKMIYKIDLKLEVEMELPRDYNIVECCNCGFCYADTHASIQDYDFYYSNFNAYGEMPGKLITEEELFDKINAFLSKECIGVNDQLLDMGFGNGDLLKWLNLSNYNTYGVDPSVDSVNNLINCGIKASVGNIYDFPNKKEYKKSKMVFLMSVAEHLLDPYEGIGNMLNYLRDDGYLCMYIPVFDFMDQDNSPVVNNFNQEHINYFSEQSLDNLATRLNLLKIQSFNIPIAYSENSHSNTLLIFYKKSVIDSVEIIQDTKTANSITRYCERKSKDLDCVNSKINEFIGKEVMIWGTGAYTKYLLQNTELDKCNIISYIDNNVMKIGEKCNGKIIISPDQIVEKHFEGIILISSMLYSNNILEQIKEMEMENPVYIL